MSITKLIADMDMDLDIVDISEDENTEKTGIKWKDGNAVTNSGQNETEINNGKREINAQNEYASEINWDLLEIEADHEEVTSQKESQGSDNSVLLLEVGSDPLLLSSREEDLNMNENDCLDLDVEGKGNNNLQGLSQNIVVSSSESRISSENMMLELTFVNKENELKNKNTEGINNNLDLDLNASENLNLALDVGENNLQRLNENSAISDDENKEFAEKKEGFVLVSANNKEMENENKKVLDKNGDLDADKNQNFGLDLLSENKVSEIEIEGLNEKNSASDAYGNNNMCLGTREADDNLKGSSGSSVVSFIESKGCVPKEGVNSEVLIENCEEVDHEKLNLDGVIANSNAARDDSEMNGLESALDTSIQDTTVSASKGAETNRVIANSNAVRGDSGQNGLLDTSVQDTTVAGSKAAETNSVIVNSNAVRGDSGQNGLLDTSVQDTTVAESKAAETNSVIANSIIFRGDSGQNGLDMALDTSVQDTIVGPSKGTETNRDQTEKTEPLVDNTNTSFSFNNDQRKSNNELEMVDLVGNFLSSKSTKRRGRPRKAKGKMNVVFYKIRESSSSQGKRERKDSKYLSAPYVSIGDSEFSPKRLKREKSTNGVDNKLNKREDKKVKKTADDDVSVSKGNDGKTEKFSEEVVGDLISAAQCPLNPQNSILTKPTKGFLTAFRNSVSPSEVAIGPPPVLLDARDKLVEMILSFLGSGLEDKESLIGDAWGLLAKVNLTMTKNAYRYKFLALFSL